MALACLASTAATFASSFVLTATDVAQATILESQRRGILRLAVGNPAVGGPATVLVSSFGLRLEQSSGAGLGTIEASNLFDSIEVYLDADASGTFSPATDTLIAALYSPDLAADGGLSIDLATSHPADVQVATGSTRNYFIVVRAAASASAASPNSFRITHVGGGAGASSATDAASGDPLTLTAAGNVTSKIVTATVNQQPTTTGIADVVTFENSGQGLVALYPAFQDAEDASNQLSYTLTGNSNPGLFAYAGIEASTGNVLIGYVPGITGSSQLTVKATDTLGKFVTATFQVKVIPFITYSDFQALHPAAGGPLEQGLGNGLTNLLSYALFLKNGANGGTMGLPRMQATGDARIFSHLRPKQVSDVLYSYQLSQDMQTWVPAVKNFDYYEHIRDLGDGSVRVELLLLNVMPKAFMRVQTQLLSSPAPPLPPPPPSEGAAVPPDGEPGAGLPPPPPPSPGVPIQSSVVFPAQTVLSTALSFGYSVQATDLDNDGFKDLITSARHNVGWFHNNHDGTFGSFQVIDATSGFTTSEVVAVDMDNDGLVDAVSVSANNSTVQWYKRNVNGTFGSRVTIATGVGIPYAVEVADLDNDGKPDVIWSELFGDKISWCRNLGNGVFAAKQTLVTQTYLNLAFAPLTVLVADLDGDGILDIATGSLNQHSVTWYKGNGNGTFGTTRLLAQDNIEVQTPASLAAADLNGDGMVDLVATYTATSKIVWFRNTGNSTFAPREIVANFVPEPDGSGPGVRGVSASDMDGDGKPDIVCAIANDDRVAWYRNLGGGNFGDPNANQIVITNSTVSAYATCTADFDHDGLLDVASASQNDSKVAVYLNRGGQTGLSSTDVAPAAIVDGQQSAMLRINVSNRGQSGNNNARLDTVSLLLESGVGVPLTTAQANALFDSLSIYADTNDNGVFDAGTDQPVAIVPYLSLNLGKLTVTVRGNALAVQVAPGTTRGFFVVPRLTADAAAQNPNSFRLTHFTQGVNASTARDAFSGAMLSVEASTASSLVSSVTTATVNSAPTTIGLPNITVRDTPIPSTVAIRNYFADAEDGSAGLSYTLTGNTNPGLFSFVGIDSAGTLLIRYRPGIPGTANITVRATDTLGKWVASTMTVTVALADTYSHWSGGTAVSGLPGYAFALSLQGGDVAGLPKIKIQNKAKIVTHLKPTWATDLTYQYEISQDLLTWIPAIREVHFHEFTKDLPNAIRQSDCVLMVNWPKAYMRVRAVLAP